MALRTPSQRLRDPDAVFARGDDTGGGLPSDLLQVASRRIDISATEIRRRLARGESIRYLVPEAVATIIRDRRLYTPARAADSESEIVQTPTQPGALPSLKKP